VGTGLLQLWNDSLYVLRVDYVGTTITAQFHRDYELLNGQPTACPY